MNWDGDQTSFEEWQLSETIHGLRSIFFDWKYFDDNEMNLTNALFPCQSKKSSDLDEECSRVEMFC